MMKRMMMIIAALTLLFGSMGQVKADQLVVNGGFETGDFTAWSLVGNLTSVSTGFANSGNYGVAYGQVGSLAFLSQTITTMPGATYTFEFYQQTRSGTPNEFQAYFGGVKILDLVNSPASVFFTHYTFNEVATGTSTEVKFGLRQDPSFSALDDISVTTNNSPPPASPTPEPATLTMLGFGVVSLVGYGWRRRNQAARVAV